MDLSRHRMLLAAALGLAGLSVGVAAPGAPPSPAPAEIVVYAAASLRDVLQRLAPACETSIGARLVFNFGASNDLARQIEAAGKADVFLSADEAWMDRVAKAGLVDAASRRSLLSNRLVVVGASDSVLKIASASDLGSPAVRRVALAYPEAVPAGKYAKAWLEKAGVWTSVADRVVPLPDVRAALAAVESGAADVGVVYRTDAVISKQIKVLFEVPAADGLRISYAVAALGGRPNLERARRVVAFLAGPEASAVFEGSGFIVLPQAP
jgi:molybdate transport system substrate-binding protein